MKTTCSVPGCAKREKARGWCSMHYFRWAKHGDPLVGRSNTPSGVPAAFLNTAISYSGDDCILWPYAKNNAGYGQINMGRGFKKLAHRFVCESINGPPPTATAFAVHSCGNGHLGCVTPKHLRWATPKENSADMIRHGRSTRGTASFANKLSERAALEIYRRARAGEPQLNLAVEYGVSQTAVSKIYLGKTWRWLTQFATEAA